MRVMTILNSVGIDEGALEISCQYRLPIPNLAQMSRAKVKRPQVAISFWRNDTRRGYTYLSQDGICRESTLVGEANLGMLLW
jgi:hypothetical protein